MPSVCIPDNAPSSGTITGVAPDSQGKCPPGMHITTFTPTSPNSGVLEGVGNTIVHAAQSAGEAVKSAAGSAAGTASGAAEGAGGAVKSAAGGAAGAAGDAVKSAAGAILPDFSFLAPIGDFFKTLTSGALWKGILLILVAGTLIIVGVQLLK